MFSFNTIASCLLIFMFPLVLNAQAPKIYINEVVASNINSLYDEFFEYPDWIELYNDGLNDVNLEGYSISNKQGIDEPWVFPSFTIPAKGYMYLFASGRDLHDPPVIWDTKLDWGDSLKYLIPDASAPINWYKVEYNDEGWKIGKSGFGYGDNDDATQLPEGTVSVFLRATFQVDQIQSIKNAILHMDYDDAFVAYLNGVEIARSNIGVVGTIVAYNQLATADSHEALMYQQQPPEAFPIENIQNFLINGTNILAIQVHNASTGSSDFTAIPFLSLGYSSNPGQTKVSSYLNIINSSLHTHFNLNKNGETITLFDPKGIIADSLKYQTLMPDISYGRSVYEPTKLGYMAQPTPGYANNDLVDSIGNQVLFSIVGGFYYDTLSLVLTTNDPTDSIYYTTNGNYPTTSATLYTEPILVSKTTVVRAFAANSKKLSGEVSSHSFFVLEEVNLPVISLVTDADHFFSDESGIYVTGTNGIPGMCDGFPRNLNQDWERPVNIEFYEADGTLKLNQMAGVKIFGGCSRTRFPEKSLAIFARNDYGKGSFKYPFFADKPIDEFESFLLRSGADDQVSTMFRDPLATTVMAEYMDVDYQAYRPVVVYLNGEYWGIHNLQEKINEHYLASNFNVDADKANILDKDGAIVTGDNSRYKAMLSFAEKNDLSVKANYDYMESQMDINQYIDYQIANIYLAEGDWPGNNIKFWSADESAYTRWRWLQYDRDQTFKNTTTDAMAKAAKENCNCGWPNPPWSTALFRRLLKNDEFKNKFIQLFAFHMATTFDPDRLIGFINQFEAAIEDEIPRHITKWGGKRDEDSTEGFPEPTFSSVSQWEGNVEDLRSFSIERPNYAASHIKSYFKLSGTTNLTITQSDNNAGYVKLFQKKLPINGYSAGHFKAVPIELSAIANVGYEFLKWVISDNSGEKVKLENTISVVLTETTSIQAYFKVAENSEGPIVIINEINYNSDSTFNAGDWVELFNRHTSEVDLNGWMLKDSEDENTFLFPKGTVIKERNYFVVTQKISDFSLLFPLVKNLTGDLGFKLGNGGEVVRLYDATGALVDSVHYFDSKPWPKDADGKGYTLELMDTGLENDWAESWMASNNTGGTPGWENGTAWVSNNEIELAAINSVTNFKVYPNPISNAAHISFKLVEPSRVKISIIDYMGREVQLISSGNLGAGNYATLFNRGNLIPGIYICSLWIEGRMVDTVKIVVL